MAGKRREDTCEEGVQHTLTLGDGTLMRGLPVLVQAALADPRAAKLKAKFRLHTQFDLDRGAPIRIDVTEGIGKGEADERAVPASKELLLIATSLLDLPAGIIACMLISLWTGRTSRRCEPTR